MGINGNERLCLRERFIKVYLSGDFYFEKKPISKIVFENFNNEQSRRLLGS